MIRAAVPRTPACSDHSPTALAAYMISRRGAFGIEKTAVGFRVRMISGKGLKGGERAEIRAMISRWNQNNGGSGLQCTFTPGG